MSTERYHLVILLPESGDSFFNGLLDGATKVARDGAALQVFSTPGPTPPRPPGISR